MSDFFDPLSGDKNRESRFRDFKPPDRIGDQPNAMAEELNAKIHDIIMKMIQACHGDPDCVDRFLEKIQKETDSYYDEHGIFHWGFP